MPYDPTARRRIYRAQIGAYLLIVLIGAFGFWQMQQQQDRIEHLQGCTTAFLGSLLSATSERTTYSIEQVNANVQLQKAQAKVFGVLLDDNHTDAELHTSLKDYFTHLTDFINTSSASATKQEDNPYPDPASYQSCLDH